MEDSHLYRLRNLLGQRLEYSVSFIADNEDCGAARHG